MDINTKSKYRRGSSALSENEINDLLNVVKESAEAVAEAAKDLERTSQDSKATLAQNTPVVETPKAFRKFYAIERNSGKFDVVEAIEQDGVIKRSRVVFSHNSLEVAIAKMSETISRLCMIKKEF